MDTHRTLEAGRNRSLKLIRMGKVRTIWIASDADKTFAEEMEKAAGKAGLIPNRTKTRKQIAEMCKIEVLSAVAVETILDTDS